MANETGGPPVGSGRNVVWWLIGLIIIALLIWWFVALPAVS